MPLFQANSYFFLQDHTDALGQGAHCFVSFFVINIDQIIV